MWFQHTTFCRNWRHCREASPWSSWFNWLIWLILSCWWCHWGEEDDVDQSRYWSVLLEVGLGSYRQLSFDEYFKPTIGRGLVNIGGCGCVEWIVDGVPVMGRVLAWSGSSSFMRNEILQLQTKMMMVLNCCCCCCGGRLFSVSLAIFYLEWKNGRNYPRTIFYLCC